MSGFLHLSLRIPIALCRDLLFLHSLNLVQIPLYLVGTILKIYFLPASSQYVITSGNVVSNLRLVIDKDCQIKLLICKNTGGENAPLLTFN